MFSHESRLLIVSARHYALMISECTSVAISYTRNGMVKLTGGCYHRCRYADDLLAGRGVIIVSYETIRQ